eukprot:g340.t1
MNATLTATERAGPKPTEGQLKAGGETLRGAASVADLIEQSKAGDDDDVADLGMPTAEHRAKATDAENQRRRADRAQADLAQAEKDLNAASPVPADDEALGRLRQAQGEAMRISIPTGMDDDMDLEEPATPPSGGRGWIQIGDWRLGRVGHIWDGVRSKFDHFSIAHRTKKAALILRSDGQVIQGPNKGWHLWRLQPLDRPVDVTYGNGFVEFGGVWRMGEFNTEYMSIQHVNAPAPNVVMVSSGQTYFYGTGFPNVRYDLFEKFKEGCGKENSLVDAADCSEPAAQYCDKIEKLEANEAGWGCKNMQYGKSFVDFGHWRFGQVDLTRAAFLAKGNDQYPDHGAAGANNGTDAVSDDVHNLFPMVLQSDGSVVKEDAHQAYPISEIRLLGYDYYNKADSVLGASGDAKGVAGNVSLSIEGEQDSDDADNADKSGHDASVLPPLSKRYVNTDAEDKGRLGCGFPSARPLGWRPPPDIHDAGIPSVGPGYIQIGRWRLGWAGSDERGNDFFSIAHKAGWTSEIFYSGSGSRLEEYYAPLGDHALNQTCKIKNTYRKVKDAATVDACARRCAATPHCKVFSFTRPSDCRVADCASSGASASCGAGIVADQVKFVTNVEAIAHSSCGANTVDSCSAPPSPNIVQIAMGGIRGEHVFAVDSKGRVFYRHGRYGGAWKQVGTPSTAKIKFLSTTRGPDMSVPKSHDYYHPASRGPEHRYHRPTPGGKPDENGDWAVNQDVFRVWAVGTDNRVYRLTHDRKAGTAGGSLARPCWGHYYYGSQEIAKQGFDAMVSRSKVLKKGISVRPAAFAENAVYEEPTVPKCDDRSFRDPARGSKVCFCSNPYLNSTVIEKGFDSLDFHWDPRMQYENTNMWFPVWNAEDNHDNFQDWNAGNRHNEGPNNVNKVGFDQVVANGIWGLLTDGTVLTNGPEESGRWNHGNTRRCEDEKTGPFSRTARDVGGRWHVQPKLRKVVAHSFSPQPAISSVDNAALDRNVGRAALGAAVFAFRASDKNGGIRGECLQLKNHEGKGQGQARVYGCCRANMAGRWTYDESLKRIRHAHGGCLKADDSDPNDKFPRMVVEPCDLADKRQHWKLRNGASRSKGQFMLENLAEWPDHKEHCVDQKGDKQGYLNVCDKQNNNQYFQMRVLYERYALFGINKVTSALMSYDDGFWTDVDGEDGKSYHVAVKAKDGMVCFTDKGAATVDENIGSARNKAWTSREAVVADFTVHQWAVTYGPTKDEAAPCGAKQTHGLAIADLAFGGQDAEHLWAVDKSSGNLLYRRVAGGTTSDSQCYLSFCNAPGRRELRDKFCGGSMCHTWQEAEQCKTYWKENPDERQSPDPTTGEKSDVPARQENGVCKSWMVVTKRHPDDKAPQIVKLALGGESANHLYGITDKGKVYYQDVSSVYENLENGHKISATGTWGHCSDGKVANPGILYQMAVDRYAKTWSLWSSDKQRIRETTTPPSIINIGQSPKATSLTRHVPGNYSKCTLINAVNHRTSTAGAVQQQQAPAESFETKTTSALSGTDITVRLIREDSDNDDQSASTDGWSRNLVVSCYPAPLKQKSTAAPKQASALPSFGPGYIDFGGRFRLGLVSAEESVVNHDDGFAPSQSLALAHRNPKTKEVKVLMLWQNDAAFSYNELHHDAGAKQDAKLLGRAKEAALTAKQTMFEAKPPKNRKPEGAPDDGDSDRKIYFGARSIRFGGRRDAFRIADIDGGQALSVVVRGNSPSSTYRVGEVAISGQAGGGDGQAGTFRQMIGNFDDNRDLVVGLSLSNSSSSIGSKGDSSISTTLKGDERRMLKGQLKSRYGDCLAADENVRLGSSVHTEPCDMASLRQQWWYNPDTGQIQNDPDFGLSGEEAMFSVIASGARCKAEYEQETDAGGAPLSVEECALRCSRRPGCITFSHSDKTGCRTSKCSSPRSTACRFGWDTLGQGDGDGASAMHESQCAVEQVVLGSNKLDHKERLYDLDLALCLTRRKGIDRAELTTCDAHVRRQKWDYVESTAVLRTRRDGSQKGSLSFQVCLDVGEDPGGKGNYAVGAAACGTSKPDQQWDWIEPWHSAVDDKTDETTSNSASLQGSGQHTFPVLFDKNTPCSRLNITRHADSGQEEAGGEPGQLWCSGPKQRYVRNADCNGDEVPDQVCMELDDEGNPAGKRGIILGTQERGCLPSTWPHANASDCPAAFRPMGAVPSENAGAFLSLGEEGRRSGQSESAATQTQTKTMAAAAMRTALTRARRLAQVPWEVLVHPDFHPDDWDEAQVARGRHSRSSYTLSGGGGSSVHWSPYQRSYLFPPASHAAPSSESAAPTAEIEVKEKAEAAVGSTSRSHGTSSSSSSSSSNSNGNEDILRRLDQLEESNARLTQSNAELRHEVHQLRRISSGKRHNDDDNEIAASSSFVDVESLSSSSSSSSSSSRTTNRARHLHKNNRDSALDRHLSTATVRSHVDAQADVVRAHVQTIDAQALRFKTTRGAAAVSSEVQRALDRGFFDIWGKIKNWLKGILNAIIKLAKGVAHTILEWVKQTWAKIYRFIMDKLKPIWDKIRGAFMKAWSGVKQFGNTLKKGFAAISNFFTKTIPKLLNKAFQDILDVFGKAMSFVLGSRTNWVKRANKIAEQNCKILPSSFLKTLCKFPTYVFFLLWGNVQDLVVKATGLIFNFIGKLMDNVRPYGKKAEGREHAVDLGSDEEAEDACSIFRLAFLLPDPMTGIFPNLVFFVGCTVVYRLQVVVLYLCDIIFLYIEKLFRLIKIPQISFGSFDEAQALCSWWKLVVLMTPFGTFAATVNLSCHLMIRALELYRSAFDLMFHLLNQLFRFRIFVRGKEAGDKCKVWRQEPYVKVGAVMAEAGFVYCTVQFRFMNLIDFAVDWVLRFLFQEWTEYTFPARARVSRMCEPMLITMWGYLFCTVVYKIEDLAAYLVKFVVDLMFKWVFVDLFEGVFHIQIFPEPADWAEHHHQTTAGGATAVYRPHFFPQAGEKRFQLCTKLHEILDKDFVIPDFWKGGFPYISPLLDLACDFLTFGLQRALDFATWLLDRVEELLEGRGQFFDIIMRLTVKILQKTHLAQFDKDQIAADGSQGAPGGDAAAGKTALMMFVEEANARGGRGPLTDFVIKTVELLAPVAELVQRYGAVWARFESLKKTDLSVQLEAQTKFQQTCDATGKQCTTEPPPPGAEVDLSLETGTNKCREVRYTCLPRSEAAEEQPVPTAAQCATLRNSAASENVALDGATAFDSSDDEAADDAAGASGSSSDGLQDDGGMGGDFEEDGPTRPPRLTARDYDITAQCIMDTNSPALDDLPASCSTIEITTEQILMGLAMQAKLLLEDIIDTGNALAGKAKSAAKNLVTTVKNTTNRVQKQIARRQKQAEKAVNSSMTALRNEATAGMEHLRTLQKNASDGAAELFNATRDAASNVANAAETAVNETREAVVGAGENLTTAKDKFVSDVNDTARETGKPLERLHRAQLRDFNATKNVLRAEHQALRKKEATGLAKAKDGANELAAKKKKKHKEGKKSIKKPKKAAAPAAVDRTDDDKNLSPQTAPAAKDEDEEDEGDQDEEPLTGSPKPRRPLRRLLTVALRQQELQKLEAAAHEARLAADRAMKQAASKDLASGLCRFQKMMKKYELLKVKAAHVSRKSKQQMSAADGSSSLFAGAEQPLGGSVLRLKICNAHSTGPWSLTDWSEPPPIATPTTGGRTGEFLEQEEEGTADGKEEEEEGTGADITHHDDDTHHSSKDALKQGSPFRATIELEQNGEIVFDGAYDDSRGFQVDLRHTFGPIIENAAQVDGVPILIREMINLALRVSLVRDRDGDYVLGIELPGVKHAMANTPGLGLDKVLAGAKKLFGEQFTFGFQIGPKGKSAIFGNSIKGLYKRMDPEKAVAKAMDSVANVADKALSPVVKRIDPVGKALRLVTGLDRGFKKGLAWAETQLAKLYGRARSYAEKQLGSLRRVTVQPVLSFTAKVRKEVKSQTDGAKELALRAEAAVADMMDRVQSLAAKADSLGRGLAASVTEAQTESTSVLSKLDSYSHKLQDFLGSLHTGKGGALDGILSKPPFKKAMDYKEEAVKAVRRVRDVLQGLVAGVAAAAATDATAKGQEQEAGKGDKKEKAAPTVTLADGIFATVEKIVNGFVQDITQRAATLTSAKGRELVDQLKRDLRHDLLEDGGPVGKVRRVLSTFRSTLNEFREVRPMLVALALSLNLKDLSKTINDIDLGEVPATSRGGRGGATTPSSSDDGNDGRASQQTAPDAGLVEVGSSWWSSPLSQSAHKTLSQRFREVGNDEDAKENSAENEASGNEQLDGAAGGQSSSQQTTARPVKTAKARKARAHRKKTQRAASRAAGNLTDALADTADKGRRTLAAINNATRGRGGKTLGMATVAAVSVGLVEQADQLDRLLGAAATAIWQAALPLFSEMRNAFESQPEAVAKQAEQAVKLALSAVREEANKALAPFEARCKRSASNATSTIVKHLNSLLEHIEKTPGEAIEAGLAKLSPVTQAKLKAAHARFELGKKGLAMVTRNAADLRGRIDTAAETVLAMVTKLRASMTTLVDEATRTIRAATSSLRQTATDLFDKVKAAAEKVLDLVDAKVNAVYNTLQSEVLGALRYLRDRADGAMSMLRARVADPVLGFLNKTKTWLADLKGKSGDELVKYVLKNLQGFAMKKVHEALEYALTNRWFTQATIGEVWNKFAPKPGDDFCDQAHLMPAKKTESIVVGEGGEKSGGGGGGASVDYDFYKKPLDVVLRGVGEWTKAAQSVSAKAVKKTASVQALAAGGEQQMLFSGQQRVTSSSSSSSSSASSAASSNAVHAGDRLVSHGARYISDEEEEDDGVGDNGDRNVEAAGERGTEEEEEELEGAGDKGGKASATPSGDGATGEDCEVADTEGSPHVSASIVVAGSTGAGTTKTAAVRALIGRLDTNIQGVADIVGVSRPSLSQWLNGHNTEKRAIFDAGQEALAWFESNQWLDANAYGEKMARFKAARKGNSKKDSQKKKVSQQQQQQKKKKKKKMFASSGQGNASQRSMRASAPASIQEKRLNEIVSDEGFLEVLTDEDGWWPAKVDQADVGSSVVIVQYPGDESFARITWEDITRGNGVRRLSESGLNKLSRYQALLAAKAGGEPARKPSAEELGVLRKLMATKQVTGSWFEREVGNNTSRGGAFKSWVDRGGSRVGNVADIVGKYVWAWLEEFKGELGSDKAQNEEADEEEEDKEVEEVNEANDRDSKGITDDQAKSGSSAEQSKSGGNGNVAKRQKTDDKEL